MIVLVHHADAVESAIDPQRPLSEAGRVQAGRLAEELAARGVRPDAIWHSGKLRARQTAETIRRACNPLAELVAVRSLQPTDPPEWIQDVVAGESRNLVLVGHMPNLARVLELLLRDGTPAVRFPQHGAVALDIREDRWIELWRTG